MTDTLDTHIRNLVTELMDSAPQAPSVSEIEQRESRMVNEVRRFPRARHQFYSRRPGVLAAAFASVTAAVLIVTLIAVSDQHENPSSILHKAFPAQTETVADIDAKSSHAVLLASQTGILQATSSVVGTNGTSGSTTKSWFNLSTNQAVLETVNPDGSPGTVVVQDPSGAVDVISYKDHAWWTESTFSAGNGQTLIPTIESAQGQMLDLEAALAKGTMQIIARGQQLDGQTTIELGGSELPSALGEHLTIWISESTYLPVQARSVDSLPTSLAPSGDLVTDTAYQWVPSTAANLAELTPKIPEGFTRLSGPPPPNPSAVPGVG